jgi:hypothetical protein
MIYYHFLLNNKKIFGLDNNDDEYNSEIDKFYNKCENNIFLLAIILRVLYGKKWVNMNIPNQELRKLYNHKPKQIKEDSYVIYKRNKIWLPKINNYMETLKYPLFVVVMPILLIYWIYLMIPTCIIFRNMSDKNIMFRFVEFPNI